MNKQQRMKLRRALRMDKCKYCHSTENLTLDHKIPVVKGGTDDFKNMQCLCSPCNQMKSKYMHGELVGLWKWFIKINKSRESKGVKPLLEKYKIKFSPLSTGNTIA